MSRLFAFYRELSQQLTGADLDATFEDSPFSGAGDDSIFTDKSVSLWNFCGSRKPSVFLVLKAIH